MMRKKQANSSYWSNDSRGMSFSIIVFLMKSKRTLFLRVWGMLFVRQQQSATSQLFLPSVYFNWFDYCLYCHMSTRTKPWFLPGNGSRKKMRRDIVLFGQHTDSLDVPSSKCCTPTQTIAVAAASIDNIALAARLSLSMTVVIIRAVWVVATWVVRTVITHVNRAPPFS